MVADGKPALRGNGDPPFYDLAMSRWVPVTPAQTSPDGAFYAYSTDQTQIHVVHVAHGSDRTFPLPVPPQFSDGIRIEDFDGRGVYFLYGGPAGQQLGGLWRLDVGSGSVKTVAQLKWVAAVRAGYAWVAAIDPRDTSRPLANYLLDSLIRVDLATGAKTLWYYAPGQGVWLRGFDGSGDPVIYVYTAPDISHADIRIATGPLEAGTEVYNGPMLLYQPQADRGRLWFENVQGIYLFTAAAGLQKVFAFSPDPPFAEDIEPVGFCL